MNAQELVAKIKGLVFDTPTPPAPPAADPNVPADPNAAPVSNITVDGKTVVVNGPVAVGSDVTVDGQPAPAGDYVFPDGSKISVDDSSKISAVSIEPAMPPGMDMNDQIGQMKSDFAAHKQAFEEYKSGSELRFAKAEETIGQQAQALAKQDEVIKQLFTLCEQLAGSPSADPIAEPTPRFSFSKVEGKKKSHERFQSALAILNGK